MAWKECVCDSHSDLTASMHVLFLSLTMQDPRKLARQWQNTMKMKVFDHFVKSRVLGRIR